MKRALVAALLLVLVGSTAAVAMLRARKPALPVLGAVPAFSLTGADGKPFGSHDLDGRVWVVDFVFTSCPEVCPRMTDEMARLQSWLVNRGLDGRVHLVSISVDPARDTPAALRAYAERFHARPTTWSFLTGPQQTIEDAVVHGFKIGLGREAQGQDNFAIVHGTKFVLVDPKQQIRGYYDTGDGEAMARLRADAQALAEGAR